MADTNGDDVWLRIDKPARPPLPDPPDECVPWVDRATLGDTTQQPALVQGIVDPAHLNPPAEADEEAIELPRLRLADFPDVVDAWEAYVERQWLPWREQHQRWERVQDAYRQLFGMYQLQRRRGEQFELVLGVGTLLWKSDSGHRVRRPVITAQAAISLESVSGCITVGPAPEGARFALEQDMLEVEERPPVEDQRWYEEQVSNLESLWGRQQVFELLTRWANTLPVADAEFSDALSCPEQATGSSKVVFAPVLMLRRRSGRTLRSAIRKVLDQLQDATTIPLGIREVCGDFAHRHHGDGHTAMSKTLDVPEELLFPLPSNSEQGEIVHRLNGHPGVLVQGPPGTGKSHTIANLICHFLAHGKRVLVTSQTPRALKVLHDKIPKPLRSLCVSVLGSDQGSLRSLEQSVHGILSAVNAWNAQEKQEEIERIAQERRAGLSELARLRRLQREARETETIEHFVAETPYHGTPQKTAQQLEASADELGWIEDDIPEDAACPLARHEIAELADLRTELSQEDLDLPDLELPNPADLPPADKIRRETAKYLAARSAVSQLGDRASAPRVVALSRIDDEALRRLANLAGECCQIQQELAEHGESWVGRAVADILQGNHHSWISLHRYTTDSLEYLRKAPCDASLTLRTPPKVDERQLLGDAKDLLQHLKSGKGLGFWIFRAPVVKRCQYLWQSYRFNGRLCDSVSTLQALVDHRERLFLLRRVWSEWSRICSPPSGTFRQHLEALEECQRLLRHALTIQELAETASAILSDLECPGGRLIGATWAGDLLQDVHAARAVREMTAAKSELDELTDTVLTLCERPMLAPVLMLGDHPPNHEALDRLVYSAKRLDADGACGR